MKVTHWVWIPKIGGMKAFCGTHSDKLTVDKTKVSCRRCRAQMKLHGHLHESEA